jgi:hypothetical protein
VVESSALLKRRSPKGYRGFESLPHRFPRMALAESRKHNIHAFRPRIMAVKTPRRVREDHSERPGGLRQRRSHAHTLWALAKVTRGR